MQTKLGSFVEAITNTLIGLVLAFILNMLLMGAVGVTATVGQNATIVLGHTVFSVGRSYLIRRLFNGAWATNIKSTLKNWKEFLG